jgi:hypothetical protein
MAPTIAEIIQARLSRRAALKGIAAGSALGLFGCSTPGSAPSPGGDGSAPLEFEEVGRSTDATHHVAAGYTAQVLIRQGDPIRRGGPAYRPGQQTGAEQEQQFGTDNDFIAYMPLPRGSSSSTRGLLGVNHENHRAALCFPAVKHAADLTREQCAVQMAAQGHSILEIERRGNAWRVVDGSTNRRISANTEMRIAGPAAGHPRMRTSYDPSGKRVLGTFNNCAGGTTPWGTILSAEENTQLYFAGDPARGPEAATRRRYNITGRNLRYEAWSRYFERFDMAKEPNEPNRFGWIVEIDPYDPKSVPVKRTALGRAAHECATGAMNHDGRVAFYSGDDARMEYVYKFVTQDRYSAARPEANRDLLDRGTLYVARFEADGKVRWLPLVHGEGPLTTANGFTSQADVVIEARHAGDLLGATPMDRPEDVEADPLTGRVYVVLTYNEQRRPDQLNPANPRPYNRFGHIIEIVPPLANGKPDHGATVCDWGFYLLGGNPADPSHGARYGGPVSENGWLAAPDNIAFDPQGRLWIATDGQHDRIGFNDTLYGADVSGPDRGITRAFFTGPRGSEICGPAFTPDGTTLFLAVQHPGDEKGSTFEKPSTRWPDFREDLPPRSSVLAITRDDGGEIGG